MSEQEQIDAIDQAMAANPEGRTEITINGRTTQRVSPLQMLRVRGILEARQARRQRGFFVLAQPTRPTS